LHGLAAAAQALIFALSCIENRDMRVPVFFACWLGGKRQRLGYGEPGRYRPGAVIDGVIKRAISLQDAVVHFMLPMTSI
jgi:hypothetical protein